MLSILVLLNCCKSKLCYNFLWFAEALYFCLLFNMSCTRFSYLIHYQNPRRLLVNKRNVFLSFSILEQVCSVFFFFTLIPYQFILVFVIEKTKLLIVGLTRLTKKKGSFPIILSRWRDLRDTSTTTSMLCRSIVFFINKIIYYTWS